MQLNDMLHNALHHQGEQECHINCKAFSALLFWKSDSNQWKAFLDLPKTPVNLPRGVILNFYPCRLFFSLFSVSSLSRFLFFSLKRKGKFLACEYFTYLPSGPVPLHHVAKHNGIPQSACTSPGNCPAPRRAISMVPIGSADVLFWWLRDWDVAFMSCNVLQHASYHFSTICCFTAARHTCIIGKA